MHPSTTPAGEARTATVPAPRSGDRAPEASERIVVGVDGSASSVRALVWAMRHAVEEGCSVLVLTAWPLGSTPDEPREPQAPGVFDEDRWAASEAQARAIAHARSFLNVAPRIERALVNTPTLDAIVAAAGPATLIVLGTDRPDDPSGPQRAPTSLTSHAQESVEGPVILVPNESTSIPRQEPAKRPRVRTDGHRSRTVRR